MELAVITLACVVVLLAGALVYTMSLVRAAHKAVTSVACDAITASRAVSATDFVQARAFNKLTDTPIEDLPAPPQPPPPRVFTTPEGVPLEPLRPR